MRRMARVAYEAALAHYMDDSKRRIALHGERRSPPIELSVRTAFKVHDLINLICVRKIFSTCSGLVKLSTWTTASAPLLCKMSAVASPLSRSSAQPSRCIVFPSHLGFLSILSPWCVPILHYSWMTASAAL